MQIDEIIITSGPAYAGGAFTDFFIDPIVFGSGMLTIPIMARAGLALNLIGIALVATVAMTLAPRFLH